ncbi:MAG: serine/threonine-protein phosphatase [Clostridiales bacterium]|jgi:serine/threonine protein phosphatase PrpC|nr:serine/threonine-protein phosphatase [Clostridiales bacterium]
MKILTAAFSDKGGRPNNEDSFVCAADMRGLNFRRDAVWAVADGLGGMVGGELASSFVTEYIKRHALLLDNFSGEALLQLMNSANQALLTEQERRQARRGMRTTVAAAFMEKGVLTAIHFGDSRFYYFRENKLFYQSRDHSMSQVAVDLGEITPADIRFHEDRSRVLKVLGNDEVLQTKAPIFKETVRPGDAFMLCTDGFWELILEEEMTACLRRSLPVRTPVLEAPQIWLDGMLGVLRPRLKPCSDNYTAVCCMA